MLAVALGLSASVCWGLSDFLGGMVTRKLPGMVVVMLSQVVGIAILLAATIATGGLGIGGEHLLAAMVSGLAGAIGLTCFYKALSIGTMSIVAPITATGAIVPVIVGLADGDDPTTFQALGMVAAAIGVILATQDGGGRSDEQRRVSRQSILLALVAAVGIGVALAALDRATGAGAMDAVFVARMTSATVLLAAVAALRPAVTVTRTRAQWRGLLAIGVLDAAATSLYALATTEGLLSAAAVLSSLYPVVTVLLARTILSERVQRLQAVGVLAALGGVVLVAFG